MKLTVTVTPSELDALRGFAEAPKAWYHVVGPVVRRLVESADETDVNLLATQLMRRD